MLISEIKDFAMGLLNSLSGGDPVARGLITVWALTSFSWLGRSIPKKIISFIKHHSLVTFGTTKEDDARSQEFFTNLEEFFFNNNWFTNRNQRAAVNKMADGDGFGYGTHLVLIKGRLFWVMKHKLDNNVSGKVMEALSITTIGRNPAVFDKIAADARLASGKRYFWTKADRWGAWSRRRISAKSPKLYLDPTLKKTLDTKLDFFKNNRAWYEEQQKPYRLNIVLYGPPGTGKTELTRYIADSLDADIYQPSVSNLSMEMIIGIAKQLVPGRKALIALEDFEAIALSRNIIMFREELNAVENKSDAESKAEAQKLKKDPRYEVNKALGSNRSGEFTMSDMLNTLQGLQIIEDLIIVMTTNHIEVIDEAILRGSRCNLKLFVGPLGIEQVKEKFQDTYNKPLPPYIGNIKPIKACDIDDLFSNFVGNPDGLVEKLLTDYGIEEPTDVVAKELPKDRVFLPLDRAMINTGFTLSRDAKEYCSDFAVDDNNIYKDKTTETLFQFWIKTKPGIEWVNKFISNEDKINA